MLMSSEKVPLKSTIAVRTLAVVLAKLRHEFRTHLNAIIGSSDLLLEDCQTPACQRLIPDLKKVQLSGQHMLRLVNKLLDPDELESRTSDHALKECATEASRALRSPINSVIGSSEALLKDAADLGLPNLLNDLQNIRTACGKLLALIDRLESSGGGGAAEVKRESAGSQTSTPSSPKMNPTSPLDSQKIGMTSMLTSQKIGMTDALRPVTMEEIEIASGERGHLLVVDRNKLDRDLIERRLSRFGHTVATAESGRQALEMMRAEKFDLVLLDILMPEMNGFQMLQEIQDDEALREIPVIIASSLHETDSIARAVALGAADYLPKPFNTILLRARIGACLEKKRMRDQEVFYLRELERLNQDLEVRNEFIRQAFGRYTSEELVAQFLETPDGLGLGGETRRVTILMSDLRGFTSMSERLSPDQIVTLLNSYLGTMAEVIMQYQGLIDEFIGDAILAIFGAPIHREDDAGRAVACAVAMQLAMESVNEQNRRAGLPEVAMGIGLNTGEVVAGNIGSLKRTKYGVIGSQVNLTSRIESFTIGGQILIPESTREAVGDMLRIDGQMTVEPKGVKEPITLYDVGGIGGEYNLFLPEKTAQSITLREDVLLLYWVIEGKMTQVLEREGRLVELSPAGARLRLESEVAPFSNLKMRFLDANGAVLPGDLYGKVGAGIVAERNVYVSFTSISPEVELLFQNLMARQ
ncbi:MAG: adenylate/guanylate cyclase domain-containing protein [Blastocatellales bacterium]